MMYANFIMLPFNVWKETNVRMHFSVLYYNIDYRLWSIPFIFIFDNLFVIVLNFLNFIYLNILYINMLFFIY